MDDLLARLASGERVVDLGAGRGSFPYQRYSFRTIAIDADPAGGPAAGAFFLAGRSASLPLADQCAGVVIGNHLFEHLADPRLTVREVARILRPDGVLFATVPDGSSLADRLYRFWTLEGGHVQRYSFRRFQQEIESASDLELLYARRLYSSFSFFHPRLEAAIYLPRRSQLLRFLPAWARDFALGLLNTATRAADALLGTRLSYYGWACYYGRPAARVAEFSRQEFVNVCSRCGAGHPCAHLKNAGARLTYRCPQCGRRNPFFGPWLEQRITERPWEEEEYARPTPPQRTLPAPAQAGAPGISAVVNAASYEPVISPGSLVAVFGENLAGASLLVEGRRVPVLHSSERQITAYLPPDLPRRAVAIHARRGTEEIGEIRCILCLTSPGLFSSDASGKGTAATVETGMRDRVTLLATGIGPVTSDGLATRRCRAWIAGQPARIEFCGLSRRSPDPGVYEVRARVPRREGPRPWPVLIEIGGRRSNVLILP